MSQAGTLSGLASVWKPSTYIFWTRELTTYLMRFTRESLASARTSRGTPTGRLAKRASESTPPGSMPSLR